MENGRMTGLQNQRPTEINESNESNRKSKMFDRGLIIFRHLNISPILFLKMPKKDNVGVGFAIYQSQISKLSHTKLTIFV